MSKKTLSRFQKATLFQTCIIFALFIAAIGFTVFVARQEQNLRGKAAEGDCSSSVYDAAILADNPLAYWQLRDSSPAVTDCTSAQAHPGLYTNAPTSTSLPNGDMVKVFDGATQYAQIPDSDDLSASKTGVLTIEAWMRPDTLQFDHQESTGYVHWLGKGVSGQHEYVARMYSQVNEENRPNRISGYAFNLAGGLGAGSYFQDAVTVGEWIHYTLVINTLATSSAYPTGYTKLFKNGVLRDQDSLKDYSIIPSNGTAPFRIGTRDLSSFFKGAIGKVAVYNYELTPVQLLAHYQAMFAPSPTASLTATPTILPSSVPTLTPVPTSASVTVTLNTIADTYVASDKSKNNFGNGTTLLVDGSPSKIGYLMFDLSSFAGKAVVSAKLRVKVATKPSKGIQNVKRVTDTSWSETGMTYLNRPALASNVLGTIDSKNVTGVWKDVDVTAAVSSSVGSRIAFGLDSSSGDDINFFTKESSGNKPELVIVYK